MTIKIEVRMDNAAFDDLGELARILRGLADHVDGRVWNDEHGSTLKDANGNTVGTWAVTL